MTPQERAAAMARLDAERAALRMENIEFGQTGDGKLVLTLDPNYRGERTKSDKSTVVASTHGIISIPGTNLRLNCTVFTK